MYPTPEDPGRAPVWENYVVAQTVQASLGLVPRHALAVGVEVVGVVVRLRFQFTETTEDDHADVADIVSELEVLVGEDVRIEVDQEIRREPVIRPWDGVRWIYRARE